MFNNTLIFAKGGLERKLIFLGKFGVPVFVSDNHFSVPSFLPDKILLVPSKLRVWHIKKEKDRDRVPLSLTTQHYVTEMSIFIIFVCLNWKYIVNNTYLIWCYYITALPSFFNRWKVMNRYTVRKEQKLHLLVFHCWLWQKAMFTLIYKGRLK